MLNLFKKEKNTRIGNTDGLTVMVATSACSKWKENWHLTCFTKFDLLFSNCFETFEICFCLVIKCNFCLLIKYTILESDQKIIWLRNHTNKS